MAKSAFEEYPRETAVRLILLMGGTGLLLVVAGLLGQITTFWAAGTVLILFAVASWPEQAPAKRPPTEEPTRGPRGAAEDITDDVDPALKSVMAQLESARARVEFLQEEVDRRQEDNADWA